MRKFIVIVEDNPDDQLMVNRALDEIKPRPESYLITSGSIANEYFKNDVAQRIPDLIILDIRLPGIDGTDIVSTIRSRPQLAMVPIVMTSTSARALDVEDSYRAGANGYVQKGDLFAWSTRLRATMDYWLNVNVSVY